MTAADSRQKLQSAGLIRQRHENPSLWVDLNRNHARPPGPEQDRHMGVLSGKLLEPVSETCDAFFSPRSHLVSGFRACGTDFTRGRGGWTARSQRTAGGCE